MEKKYVVVGYGQNKEDKKPYSRLAAVMEGKEYGYYNFKDVIYTDTIMPLGTIKILKG